MTPLLTNWALKSLMCMAAIGFASLLYGIRCLFDQIKDTNAGGSNVGDEQ